MTTTPAFVDAFFNSTKQPCRCCGAETDAALFFEGMVLAEYGSVHDGDRMVFVKNAPAEGVLCDACIDNRLENGDLEVVYDDFDGVNHDLSLAGQRAAFTVGAARFVRDPNNKPLGLHAFETGWLAAEAAGLTDPAGIPALADTVLGVPLPVQTP